MHARRGLTVLGLLALLAACGSATSRSGFGATETETSNTEGDGGAVGVLGNGKQIPTVKVSFSGTVYAPNGDLPMANTLVYITKEEPAEIPEGAYCDTCVTLPAGTFALSAADGTFEIDADLPTGNAWVVVQKGQFRRVRKVKIEEDEKLEVEDEMFTLPGRSGKGDDVPRMLVLKDSHDYDKIDGSLNKLGIQEFEVRNDRKLLNDETELMKYHVVFIPCGSLSDPLAASENVQNNLRNFVAAGGKLYVTDYSFEFVRQPFPGYITWKGEGPSLGSAAVSQWSAPAEAVDEGLGEWLAETGHSSFSVEKNYTEIESVNVTTGLDAEGNEADIEPTVWVTADKNGVTSPTTVSFGHQCGRVLFSTYHTEPTFGTNTLFAQEKALLYVLLEVGVCIGEVGGIQ